MALRWFPNSPILHFLRGSVLEYAGCLAEADASFRAALEKGQSRPGLQVVSLINIGSIFLKRGKVREATVVVEAATKLNPRIPGALNELAEILLHERQNPQHVLLLIDNDFKLKEANFRMRNADRHISANMCANRARALALLGRTEEAVQAVAGALNSGDPIFIPGLAATAWRCGLALLEMKQPSRAGEQFQRAAEIDPCGYYGRLSAASLQEAQPLPRSEPPNSPVTPVSPAALL